MLLLTMNEHRLKEHIVDPTNNPILIFPEGWSL